MSVIAFCAADHLLPFKGALCGECKRIANIRKMAEARERVDNVNRHNQAIRDREAAARREANQRDKAAFAASAFPMGVPQSIKFAWSRRGAS